MLIKRLEISFKKKVSKLEFSPGEKFSFLIMYVKTPIEVYKNKFCRC